ncbi:MAG: GFA family protein [Hyphomicrobiales bacterium]|nr:GFA family protein [Hyphomicrobiales bacterium]MBV9907694.1 GFA family protein [Hyphomicrobiales bacterium]
MNQDCACLCGASRFAVHGRPIGRFFCHCTICQKAYRKPFADVTYFRAVSVTLPDRLPIAFRRHRPPPALRRGTCAKCGNPVVSLLGFPRSLALAFVPSQNFPEAAELPAPDAHIFYDCRVGDIADDVPKVSGYWASEADVTRSILAGLFGRKRAT